MNTTNLQPEEALEEWLVLEEQLAAIEEAAGAWTDEHHPELRNEEDIDRWLVKLRNGWLIQRD